MRKRIIFAATLCLTILSPAHTIKAATEVVQEVNQAGQTIRGTVVDKDGEPVIGANVQVKGANNGTITDIDGNFTLNNASGTLVVSFIGYKTQEISLAGKTVINVKLLEDAELLDEVVIVATGYGSQKKASLTSAISQIKGDEAFANKGIRVAPLFVTRIEDNEGNVISTFAPQMEEVISVSSVYKMLVMLRAVINEGTGARVRRYGITADMGGKTGTTNDNSDSWFMGFTPSLVSGCWVGGDERDIHFGSMTYGQGAAAALPIWAKYMKKVYDDPTLGYDQQEKFKLPEGFDPCAGSEASDGEVFEETGLDDLFN